jgi:hypothetical protein
MTIYSGLKIIVRTYYFHTNYDDLYGNHKNEFVAIKNLKVYHDANPLKLLELLMVDGVDTDHTLIEFMK